MAGDERLVAHATSTSESGIDNPPNEGFVPLSRATAVMTRSPSPTADGIIATNSKVVEGHPGCSRRENGFPTFGGPLAPGAVGFNGTSDCRTVGDFGWRKSQPGVCRWWMWSNTSS